MDYVSQLREGILEAYTGIVTGLKNTNKGSTSSICVLERFSNPLSSVNLLLQHAPSVLELIQRCLTDDEKTESLVKLCYGLLGDLADSFPGGQLKQLLLQPWIASELKARHRMNQDVKKTMRWARDVSLWYSLGGLAAKQPFFAACTDGQASDAMNSHFLPSLYYSVCLSSFPDVLSCNIIHRSSFFPNDRALKEANYSYELHVIEGGLLAALSAMFYAFHGSFLVFFSWFCCPRSITTYDSSDLKLYPLSVSILILFNSIYCLGFLVHFRLLSLSTIGEISSILLHHLNSCYQCELLDNFLSTCKGLIVHHILYVS